MKVRVPDYFKDFKCIGSDCPSTCCEGWGIVIDDEASGQDKEIPTSFKFPNSSVYLGYCLQE